MPHKRELLRVLAVDDEAEFLDLVEALLAASGCADKVEVERLPNAGAARERLAKGAPPDVCLVDQYLDDDDTGLSLLAWIMGKGIPCPVVIITASGDETLAVQAMKAGAADYIAKRHLTATALARALTNAVQKAELAGAIERERAARLQAERRQAMLETVVSACHYLGSPLAALIGNLQMLQATGVAAEAQREIIAECRQAAAQAARVLERLRDVKEYRTMRYLGDTKMVDLGLPLHASGTDDDA